MSRQNYWHCNTKYSRGWFQQPAPQGSFTSIQFQITTFRMRLNATFFKGAFLWEKRIYIPLAFLYGLSISNTACHNCRRWWRVDWCFTIVDSNVGFLLPNCFTSHTLLMVSKNTQMSKNFFSLFHFYKAYCLLNIQFNLNIKVVAKWHLILTKSPNFSILRALFTLLEGCTGIWFVFGNFKEC